jgi:NAD(P)H-dependent flavin oxidoreductase YrpB (nitropropane dioxygenase family)
MRTAFTDLLGVRHPIAGFNRSPAVVAAVTNAGGLGVLAATAYSPRELDAQLTWIDQQVGGRPYGVDLLVPEKLATAEPGSIRASLRAQIPAGHLVFVASLLDKYGIPGGDGPDWMDAIGAALSPAAADALLDVAFQHPIALVASALGPPPPGMVTRAQAAGVVVAALVGQPRHAVRQIDAGVDLLIAQGTEAGGHTGTIATMVLTPEIVAMAGGRPVLAAGGIASGQQLAAALALGAAGAWCGSVWLSSEEDVANQAIKDKFLRATSSDTLRSPTRTGKPARQLRSAWHAEWERPGSPAPLPMPLQPMLVGEAWERIDAAAEAGHPGALELESYYIGQVVGSFRELRPAAEITTRMAAGCERQIAVLASLAGLRAATTDPAAAAEPVPDESGPPASAAPASAAPGSAATRSVAPGSAAAGSAGADSASAE